MSNVWKKFEELLPKDPLLIGTVIAHNSDGTSTILYPGGGISVVRGQSVDVSSKAFVQNNQIQGEAPNLTTYEFEI